MVQLRGDCPVVHHRFGYSASGLPVASTRPQCVDFAWRVPAA